LLVLVLVLLRFDHSAICVDMKSQVLLSSSCRTLSSDSGRMSRACGDTVGASEGADIDELMRARDGGGYKVVRDKLRLEDVPSSMILAAARRFATLW
jgi:hypothetical protein